MLRARNLPILGLLSKITGQNFPGCRPWDWTCGRRTGKFGPALCGELLIRSSDSHTPNFGNSGFQTIAFSILISGQPRENFTISAESKKRASSKKLIYADILSAVTVPFCRKSLFLQKGVTEKGRNGGHSFWSAEILQKYSFGWPLILMPPSYAVFLPSRFHFRRSLPLGKPIWMIKGRRPR